MPELGMPAPRAPEMPPAYLAPEPSPAPMSDFDEALDFVSEGSVPDAPNVGGGEDAGAQENVDAILRMLEREGIFEAPSAQPAQWASSKEVAKGTGLRVAKGLAIAWVLVILVSVGGYFGWRYWVDTRHQEAATLRTEATALALKGDYADLIRAERDLVQARENDPNEPEAPRLLAFVHAQRALEDGTFAPGFLRPVIQSLREVSETLDEGDEKKKVDAYAAAAQAIVSAAESQAEETTTNRNKALELGANDPSILYVMGRLGQRSGAENAVENLTRAFEQEPKLAAAGIALAEIQSEQGNRQEAIAILDRVLGTHPEHLRATLLKSFFQADETDPAAGLSTLDGLNERIGDHGAATDRVLAELTRARLLRRTGDRDRAKAAVDAATQAGATEPRLLALVAAEGLAVGELGHAYRAAAAAVQVSPHDPEFRKLLATILLERRDGVRALQTLAQLSSSDPDVLRMSAQAALLVGSPDALTATRTALDTYFQGNENPEVVMKALRIRVRTALGESSDVLREAQELARSAPGDPAAALALGETALAAREARTATEALERLTQASPDDADGHYLLGRARRLNGEEEEAETSLRRAIELRSEHTPARLALGRLLLDRGRFADADTLYQELASSSGIASGSSTALLGRLGRVEALLGLGRVDDAGVQYDAIRAQDRESANARVIGAMLAVAKRRGGDAVTLLRPLAEGASPPASVNALYGDALLLAGESEAALAAYEKALEADPGLPEALLGRAELAVRAETREARDYLERVDQSLRRRVRPPSYTARYHLLLGRAYLSDGRDGRENARRELRTATESGQAPPEAFFYLGEALSGDNAPEARAAYQRYLELEPEGPFANRARRAIR
jgi:tetratricopeptide (TPR) repeat protein